MVEIKVENFTFFFCILAFGCILECAANDHSAENLPHSSSGDFAAAKVAITEDSSAKYIIKSRKTLFHGGVMTPYKSLLVFPDLPEPRSLCAEGCGLDSQVRRCPSLCECKQSPDNERYYYCYDLPAAPGAESTSGRLGEEWDTSDEDGSVTAVEDNDE